MLEVIPQGLHIDFVGKAKYFITLSLVLILLGAASIVLHGGLNEGIDFSGGTAVGHSCNCALVRRWIWVKCAMP